MRIHSWCAIVLSVSAAAGGNDITLSVKGAQPICAVAPFSEGWISSTGIADDLEFRRIGDNANSVTVAVKLFRMGETANPYAVRKYKIDLNNPAVPQVATEDEWLRSKPIPLSKKYVGAKQALGSKELLSFVEFEGKQFSRFAKYWAPDGNEAIVSPSKRWIAIQSFDSKKAIPHGEGPTEGTYYTDIYEVSSGRKVGALTGVFSRGDTGQADTLWLTENVLIMDNGVRKERLAVCNLEKVQ